METLVKEKRKFLLIGAIAAILQIVLIVIGIIVVGVLGIRPENGQQAMNMFLKSPISGLLQDEILTVWMMFLYIFTFTALFIVLFKQSPAITLFAVIGTFMAVIITICAHSAFSLMHLSKLYETTSDTSVKSGIMAAAEAVVARNMWNSTSSYFCGILLQGSGILISIAMFKSKKFKLITVIGGIMGNGIDLIQHLFHYLQPDIVHVLLLIAGPFYLAWYVFTGVDLFKLAKR